MGNSSSSDSQLIGQIQEQLKHNQIEIENLKKTKQATPQATPHPMTLQDILKNPKLQMELRNHPERKRQVLDRLLQDFSHLMTAEQVAKVRHIILTDIQQQPSPQPIQSIPSAQSLAIHQSNQLKQFNNPKELAVHYETEMEREQRQFEEEQAKRKQEFMRQQRERRREYEAKLGEIQSEQATAIQVFQLNSQYSMNELKRSYKKLAIKYHPDKPTGDKDKFQLITKYYFLLLEELKKRETDGNGHLELKNGYGDGKGSGANVFDSPVSENERRHAKENFNLKKFNDMFERYKMYDPNEEGYNDWLKSETPSAPNAPAIFSNKFNIDVFNSTFESQKSDQMPANSITEYREPQALVSCHSVGFTDIATFEKTQFDKYQENKNDLTYSDLKSAYTNGNLIDPTSVNYKTYKNVDELERARSNISYELSPAERRQLELQQAQEAEMEAMRRERLAQRDNLIGQTYQKAHQQMLGYAKGSEPPKSLKWQ